MTGLMWIGAAIAAALLVRPFLEQLAAKIWPPTWEHCDHCQAVEVMESVVRDGVTDMLGKLDGIASSVDDIRDGERRQSQVS